MTPRSSDESIFTPPHILELAKIHPSKVQPTFTPKFIYEPQLPQRDRKKDIEEMNAISGSRGSEELEYSKSVQASGSIQSLAFDKTDNCIKEEEPNDQKGE